MNNTELDNFAAEPDARQQYANKQFERDKRVEIGYKRVIKFQLELIACRYVEGTITKQRAIKQMSSMKDLSNFDIIRIIKYWGKFKRAR